MSKVFFHFVDAVTMSPLEPEELEINEKDEVDKFVFDSFLARIGVRSKLPFVREGGQKVFLAYIADQRGTMIFRNMHKI